jgi:hypothetical protein
VASTRLAIVERVNAAGAAAAAAALNWRVGVSVRDTEHIYLMGNQYILV